MLNIAKLFRLARLFALSLGLALLLVGLVSVYAQDAGAAASSITQSPDANSAWYLTLYNVVGGSVITIIVQFLKGWGPVKAHPKIVAAVLSVAATIIPVLAGMPFASKGFGVIVVSFATQLLAAVGTHQVAVKPLTGGSAASTEG